MFEAEPGPLADRPGRRLIGDKNCFGQASGRRLAGDRYTRLPRPARKGEAERTGSRLFKTLRQIVESVDESFKGRLDLERRRDRTPGGVAPTCCNAFSY